MGYHSSQSQLLNYPFMERQDLTQGQLGSFKFTPVDAIEDSYTDALLSSLPHNPHFYQSSQSPQPRFDPAYSSRYGQHSNARCPEPSAPPALTGTSQHNPTQVVSDPDFFNKHIKPDLAESRLRMGLAAFRSAVQSAATSPHKRENQDFIQPQILQPHPPFPDQRRSFDMNPIASTFTPTGTMQDYTYDDAAVVNQSLCRALASEQQAHEATRLLLHEVIVKLKAAETEIKRINKQNRSLVSSVNMLGSIIKHNIEPPREISGSGSPTKTPAQKDTMKTGDELCTYEKDSIIHDALARQRNAYESKEYPTTDAAMHPEALSTPKKPDDSVIFNLDLLKSPELDGTPASALSRTLRKHFLLDSSEPHSQALTIPALQNTSRNALIDVSPVQMDRPRDALPAFPAPVTQHSRSTSPSIEDLTKKMRTLQTCENPTLVLPSAFLAKYQKPSTTQGKAAELDDSSSESAAPAPRLEEVAASSHEYSQTNVDLQGRVVQPKSFTLNINWKVTREKPIFENDAEILSAQRQQPQAQAKSMFWNYPLRNTSLVENNIFRTVMIDSIPLGTSHKDIVANIFGGSLESIELFGPIGSLSKSMTARLVFNYEHGVISTAAHARDHGMKISDTPVRVWQVLTQTYPKSSQLEKEVFEAGYTRILVIDKASDEMLALVEDKLCHLAQYIIDFRRTLDGIQIVEFTSVQAAIKAFRQLLRDPDFRGCDFDFDPDPCAEEY